MKNSFHKHNSLWGIFPAQMQIKKKKNEKAKKESNFNKKNEIPKIKENKPPKDLGKNG